MVSSSAVAERLGGGHGIAGYRIASGGVAPEPRSILVPMPHVPRVRFAAALALIGIVILVSSLLSGVVERTGLPQVAIFLLLGAVLGPAGLGLVDLTLDSPTLQVIATLGLVLVLFSDAIGVDIGEVRAAAPPRGADPRARRPCSPPRSSRSPPGCCSACPAPRPPSSAPRSPRPTRCCSAP